MKQQFCDFREMSARYKSVRRFGRPRIAVERAYQDTVKRKGKRATPAPQG